jgi:hypothetical protein
LFRQHEIINFEHFFFWHAGSVPIAHPSPGFLNSATAVPVQAGKPLDIPGQKFMSFGKVSPIPTDTRQCLVYTKGSNKISTAADSVFLTNLLNFTTKKRYNTVKLAGIE